MKRTISIFLLVLYFLSTTELIELVKLPVLIGHFQQHKAWNSNLTFLGFLLEHYGEDTDDKPDVDLDRKLPFKSHDNHPTLLSAISVPTKICTYVFKLKTVHIMQSPHYAYANRLCASNYLSTIWQPPRFV